MPRKCKKCGNEENYNFAINNGLCDSCLGQEIEDLEEKNEKLEILFNLEKKTHLYDIGKIRELEKENKGLREALEDFLDCPRWVVKATVPRGGIEKAPDQVVLNASIGLKKVRNAQKILKKENKQKIDY